MLAAHQPVDAAGNKIECLLVLGERVVLNKERIAHDHHARRIHLHALVAAPAFFDRGRDRQWARVVSIVIELQFGRIVRIVIDFAPVTFLRLDQAAAR